MVAKSQSIAQHVVDLEEVFGELRKYDMCLNLEKCTFGVGGGKFLGFMITHWGLNPTPTNALSYWRCIARPTSKKSKS